MKRILLSVCLALGMSAAPAPEMSRVGNLILLSGTNGFKEATLLVQGPETFLRLPRSPLGAIQLPVEDEDGNRLPDGVYKFELRLRSGKTEPTVRLSGSYAISMGMVVGGTPLPEPKLGPARSKGVQANTTISPPLIVQGQACVGNGCADPESFSQAEDLQISSTLPWIHFDDTSTSLQETNDDWLIMAGDSGTGGIERFSIKNVTTGRIPFTIEGGAPEHSLYVGGGVVGIGTNLPQAALHLYTPAPWIMMEDTVTEDWWLLQTVTSQDKSYFGIRSSAAGGWPLMIEPGAPDQSFFMIANGDLGIGTATPTEKLHVKETVDANSFIMIENSSTGAAAAGVLRAKSNSAAVNFQAHGNGRTISRFGVPLASWTEFLSVQGNGLAIGTFNAAPLVLGTSSVARINITAAGNVGVGTASPAHPLQMASGAHVTAGGVWTNASSRALKENIEEISADEAAAALDALKPVTFSYTAEAGETYAGFIAEEVPELVAMKDRASLSAMDVVAVLTKVTQQQRREIEEQKQRSESQQKEIEALRSMLEKLIANQQ